MTNPAKIKFGTDGWRAVIARDYTFANLERVAQAYADYLLAQSELPFVVVGYDRRFLSQEFAARASEVMAGNGIRVSLFGEPVPTPLVSWAVKQFAGGWRNSRSPHRIIQPTSTASRSKHPGAAARRRKQQRRSRNSSTQIHLDERPSKPIAMNFLEP